MRKRPGTYKVALALVTGCATASAVVAPLSAGAEDSWFADDLQVSTQNLLAGHFYAFGDDVDQPVPALVYDMPEELRAGTQPLTVTWHWGDGTPDETLSSAVEPAPDAPGSIWCDTGYEVSGDPPAYTPSENFGYDCSTGTGHTYRKQGLYQLTITAAQPPGDGQAPVTSESSVFPQLVTDLAKGGSLTGLGTVRAPAGSGGMYDQDFGGGTVTFTVTTRRARDTAATTALVTVSVPSMRPDWPIGAGTKGLEFTGRAAMSPLWVRKIRNASGKVTGGEVWLRNVEGLVTNSAGPAGNAWATVHALVRKGRPTLVRVSLQNTAAGYTYVDTGHPAGYLDAAAMTAMLTGSLTVK